MFKLTLATLCIISTLSLNLNNLLTYYTLSIEKAFTHENNSITIVKADNFNLIHIDSTDTDSLTYNIEFKAQTPEKIEILTVTIGAVNFNIILATYSRN
jgi:hypothetical protein